MASKIVIRGQGIVCEEKIEKTLWRYWNDMGVATLSTKDVIGCIDKVVSTFFR